MVKVAVLGAAGGIGQPLSLLIKSNPAVDDLALFDVANAAGVAADLSHINTASTVKGYRGDAEIAAALSGADIIVIPAGVPRKPGMTRDDLFKINAGIIKTLSEAAAKHAPKAFLAIISNPVNSTVPIVSEVFKKAGVYDPKKIFGVTTLDIVRASTFVSSVKGKKPVDVEVPVIGGHSGPTIVPVLSATGLTFTDEERDALVQRIQYGGDEVVKAKDGAGSATLSMAFAGARFVNSLIDAAFLGKSGVTECTYIKSDVAAKDGVEYFSTVVELGPQGVKKVNPIPTLTAYEEELYKKAVVDLKSNISKGVEFITKE